MAVPERYHGSESLPTRPSLEIVTAEPVTRPSILAWIWFALQLLAIAALELGEDVFRGNIDPPDAHEAVQHARQVAQFEQAHGLFIEPALQLWIRSTHAVFGLVSYGNVVRATDIIYALGQTLVPLAIVIWIYVRHRSRFPLVRNVTLLTTLFALGGYEFFPMAPPRLTTGLVYNHHAFSFQDTMQRVIGDGKLGGTPIGYNPFSAMPSLHIAWALVVAACVIFMAHNLLARLLAGVYPIVMFLTVVVSANHYVLDAVGAVLVVGLGVVTALVLESARNRFQLWRSRRLSSHETRLLGSRGRFQTPRRMVSCLAVCPYAPRATDRPLRSTALRDAERRR
jgi:hypothetical protein